MIRSETATESARREPQGHEPSVRYGWAEIGRHNRKKDCWIVIDGAVYDVTRWIDRHPGGDIICSLAGEDVSALFHSSHFRDVAPLLRQFRIGVVADRDDAPSVPTAFLTTLKSRVFGYFRENNIDYRRTNVLRLQVMVSVLSFAALWAAVYVGHMYLLVVAMGLISCAMVGGFAHEYCHSTLIREGNRLNVQSLACSAIWALVCPFMFEKHFQYEHLSHHKLPMSEEFDYEIFALRRALRLSRSVPYRPIFKYQQYYAPLVYSFYITIQVVVGFTSSFFDKRRLSADPSFRLHVYVVPLISGLVHIALPVWLIGFWPWLACFVVYNAVWQFSTYLVAAVVHMTGGDECDSADWAYLVCARSVNVLCGNRAYDWLSGGFNYQIDHHLLPTVAREYLPSINHIVRRTCAEFGYPYKEYRSLREYCRDHYLYLMALGRPDATSRLATLPATGESRIGAGSVPRGHHP